MPLRLHYLLSCLILLGAACSTTRQIETPPPQSALAANPDTTDTSTHARLVVQVETGHTALPEEVEALRFRIDTVQIHRAGGAWVSFPADVNSFEIAARRSSGKTVLSTLLPIARYDSLAFTFSDVFVLYDANAGGPLTMPRETPLRLPIRLLTSLDQPATLHLRFQPGASLVHDENCRWFFLPFFDVLENDR